FSPTPCGRKSARAAHRRGRSGTDRHRDAESSRGLSRRTRVGHGRLWVPPTAGSRTTWSGPAGAGLALPSQNAHAVAVGSDYVGGGRTPRGTTATHASLDRGEHFTRETVIADMGYGPLHASFIAGMVHAGRVDVKMPRLRIFQERWREARCERVGI